MDKRKNIGKNESSIFWPSIITLCCCRKYLKEEAENLEKEKQGNDITTDFGDLGVDAIETTSLGSNQRTFVRVNVQGNDYSYSI